MKNSKNFNIINKKYRYDFFHTDILSYIVCFIFATPQSATPTAPLYGSRKASPGGEVAHSAGVVVLILYSLGRPMIAPTDLLYTQTDDLCFFIFATPQSATPTAPLYGSRKSHLEERWHIVPEWWLSFNIFLNTNFN